MAVRILNQLRRNIDLTARQRTRNPWRALFQDDVKLILDPRELISPPFTQCPGCKQNELGVNIIGKNSVSLRCRACGRSKFGQRQLGYRLPELAPKKVIYIDQFAISKMF